MARALLWERAMTTPSEASSLAGRLPAHLLIDGLGREYLLHHRVCPFATGEDGAILLAAAPDARLESCLTELSLAYARPIRVVPKTSSEVEALIERLTSAGDSAIELDRGSAAIDQMAGEDDGTADVRDLANQPPVVRYVNLLVRDAYDAGASDIHLEAVRTNGAQGLLTRFRLDGVLVPATEPPADLGAAVVSRIKLLAELDIAERRRPQDGRIRVRLERRELDLRVSTVPTVFGESVVLRLLDRGGRPTRLDELGMPDAISVAMARLSARPHGLLLVTGPTGSGKTTTLYSCLRTRDAHAEKLITVEDPVEYQLPGVTQVPVHAKAGITFGAALRSILRQDPDVVMVGEMRDPETAEVAVQAAMTGHLVFSTLHTNDAVGAVPRLLDLGLPAYLIAATLDGVLAQRLVRRICDECRVTYAPSTDHVLRVGGRVHERPVSGSFTRGAGCPACRGTGFRGRIGLYELLVVSDAIKEAITRSVSRAELRGVALDEGMRPLRADGWAKVVLGLTTVEEVLRVDQD